MYRYKNLKIGEFFFISNVLLFHLEILDHGKVAI